MELIEFSRELPPNFFKRHILDGENPLKVSAFLEANGVAKHWCFDYFRDLGESLLVPVKTFDSNGDIHVSTTPLSDYVRSIEQYELDQKSHRPAYCHDIPIFHLLPDLVDGVRSMPSSIFPLWYRDSWWQFAQFFMSPSGSITPLHFDTLMTHNLFFQVTGVKEFYLLPFSERSNCYRRGWRWFDVNPLNPTDEKHPKYRPERCLKVTLRPGDLLYMPPGMLHHVVTKQASISFNVDFHTKLSVCRSFRFVSESIPAPSLYYNTVALAGLFLGFNKRYLFSLYKSYLNYIS